MATSNNNGDDDDVPPQPSSSPQPPAPPPPHHLERLPRVLSIQSHVASGRVGNRAALFPLALHRLDCDAINTVSFSNHTGYPRVSGSRLSAEGLEELLAGLDANGFLGSSRGRRGYDYVLTGYVGRAETLSAIKRAIERMVKSDDGNGNEKSRRPLVVVDPVMGDHDRAKAGSSSLSSSLYVPEDVPAVYRDLLSLADVVTPNAFEAEMLLLEEGEGGEGNGGGGEGNGGGGEKGSGRGSERKVRGRFEIVGERSAVSACSALHSKGPSIVVLTSVAFAGGRGEEGEEEAPSKEKEKKTTLTLYASQCEKSEEGSASSSSPLSRFPAAPSGATAAHPAVWKLELPRIDAPFTGTGDLLTALLLSFLHKAGRSREEGEETKGKKGGEEGEEEEEKKDLRWALERAAAGVRAVVDATVAGAAAEAARAAAEEEGEGEGEEEDQKEEEQEKATTAALSSSYWASPRAVAARELRLVQCADALVAPTVVARARRIQ